MAELVKPWNDGGSLSATYEGSGDGSAIFSSDEYDGIDREMPVFFKADGLSVERTVRQEGIRQRFITADGKVFCVLDNGRFGVLKEGGVEPPVMDTYTRLDYIEATGAQYINTGYIVQETDTIEMRYVVTTQTSADKALCGVYDDGGNLWFSIYSNTGYVRFGSSSSASITNARMSYALTMKKNKVSIDSGGSAQTNFAGMPNSPLYLFARNNKNASVGMYGYCKCMAFSIKNANNEYVMDMRPCKRDTDGAIGMLDFVSGELFVNGGSGADFSYGAEVNVTNEYEAIDYVSFEDDKLYDLGIVDSTYTLEAMFARAATSAAAYLYGKFTSPHTASVSAYLSSSGSWRFGSTYKSLTMNNKSIHKVIISNGSCNADETITSFTKSDAFTTPESVVLGGYRAASGSLVKNFQGKVYYFRISKSGTPILYWLPCRRKSDGVEGFWDCVTQTFVEPI